jgi:hypothetical protein
MNYYMVAGNRPTDPLARAVYLEIAQIEEQHVSHYESCLDPTMSWLTNWVLHENNECWLYWSFLQTEVDPRIKQIWELFLGYELEHLRIAGEMLKEQQGMDPEELCGTELPTPATFETNREYVTQVQLDTVDLRLVDGGQLVNRRDLPADWRSHGYQRIVLAGGAPSESVVRLRMAAAGGELVRAADQALAARAAELRTETLDGEDAPDTAPAEVPADWARPESVEDVEIARLGELAGEVDDFKAGRKDKGRSSGRKVKTRDRKAA